MAAGKDLLTFGKVPERKIKGGKGNLKRFIYPIMVFVLALTMMVTPASVAVSAHTAEDPYVTDLIAGQHTDVGGVSVWNDETNLYVKYETTGNWYLAETHLAVAISLDGIPQKNGNPPPGQFAYQADHNPVVQTYTYTVPLNGYDFDDELYVAAHAVVKQIQPGYSVSGALVSGAGTDEVLYLPENPLNPGYPVGYTGPYQDYLGTTVPSVLAWTHSAWGPYSVASAQWIGSSYYTENTDYNTWRLFTRDFALPINAANISGTLQMNCDNAELAYLNDVYVGEDTYAPATKIYANPVPPSGPAHGWSSVESWDVSNKIVAGDNHLWTMTRNYAWGGGPTANPSGLIYKLSYAYDVSDTVVATETAWGDGDDFPGNNWAMYFNYTVQGPEPEWQLLETLTIPATGAKISSTSSLVAGDSYKFVASGTFNWRVPGSPNGYLGDAEYWLRNDTYGTGWAYMGIWSLAMWNGAPVEVDWGEYDASHTYSYEYTLSASGPVIFFINDDVYSDNSGSLTVEIYHLE